MPPRKIALTALAAFLLLAVIRISFLSGLVAPVRIAGGSMAEGLCGAHVRFACRDCRFRFRSDAEALPENLVCPNCGLRQAADGELDAAPGQRVLIDRWQPLQRGQRIAFVDPLDSSRLAVKRLVGLPGERVAVKGGQIFVDGGPYRKDLVQQREIALLVHDDAFRAARGPRWRPAETPSGWTSTTDGYRWEPPNSGGVGQDVDWLLYHHRQPFAAGGRAEGPVLDGCGYNQGVSRQLNHVRDLMLQVRLRATAAVTLLIHDGKDVFRTRLGFVDGAVELSRGDEQVFQARLPVALCRSVQDTGLAVEYSVFDRQVLVALDGRVVVQHRYEDAAGPLLPTSRPLGIGVAAGTCELTGLRVLRDIYHVVPAPDVAWDSGPLEGKGLVVLGDNSAISVDSRHWETPLSKQNVIGRVLSSWD